MGKKIYFFSLILIGIMLVSMLSINSNLGLANIQTKSNPSQTRVDQWIMDLQANYNNPSWFYTHLNTTDRLMIRNAFDYATPRTAIINSIMNGFGRPLATYAVPQEGQFAFTNVTPRPYDLNKAKTLLSEVFGYVWSHTDNSSTPYDESAPYFPITLMVPNSNPTRVQWANLMYGIFTSIGIGSTLVEFSFTNIIDRVFSLPASSQGYDFAHGGFDALFMNWGGGTFPDDGAQWYGSSYIPNNNYQNVNNTYIDYLIAQENSYSAGAQGRLNAFYTMQNYVNQQSLKSILFQSVSPFIYGPSVTGFNPYYAVSGALPVQNMTNGAKNYFTIGSPAAYSSLNPLITYDVYSNYVLKPLWLGGLLSVANPNNDVQSGYTTYNIYNNLASSYTVSTNQMFYNFTLRHGLVWADGSSITTQDVAFTYKQVLSPNRGAISYGGLAYYMNNQSIIVYDNYHIGFNLTTWADPFPFGESLFTLNVIPQATYNFTNWNSAQSNTGSSFINGVVTPAQYQTIFNGDGPYQINHIDIATGYVNLTVSPLWDTTSPSFNLTYVQQFQVPGFNVTPSLKSIAIKVESSPTTALTDLKSGAVDYVDTNIGLTDIYQSNILPLVKSGVIQEYNATGAIWQEFSLNQASPIWGFSPVNYYSGGIITSPPTTPPSSNSTQVVQPALSSSTTTQTSATAKTTFQLTTAPGFQIITTILSIAIMGIILFYRKFRKEI